MKRLAFALAVAPIVTALLVSSVSTAAEIRVITGPGISPPPVPSAPLQRIEVPAKPPAPAVERRLPWIVVESTAQIRSGRITIRLPGVVPVPLDRLCVGEDGARWACGTRARAAVSALVRLNRVTCPLPRDAREGTFEVACRLGAADFATRIVAAGLAMADGDDAPLAEVERDARDRRVGVWGPPPSVTSTPPWFGGTDAGGGLPPDRTTAPLDGGTDRPGDLGPIAPERGTSEPMALGR